MTTLEIKGREFFQVLLDTPGVTPAAVATLAEIIGSNAVAKAALESARSTSEVVIRVATPSELESVRAGAVFNYDLNFAPNQGKVSIVIPPEWVVGSSASVFRPISRPTIVDTVTHELNHVQNLSKFLNNDKLSVGFVAGNGFATPQMQFEQYAGERMKIEARGWYEGIKAYKLEVLKDPLAKFTELDLKKMGENDALLVGVEIKGRELGLNGQALADYVVENGAPLMAKSSGYWAAYAKVAKNIGTGIDLELVRQNLGYKLSAPGDVAQWDQVGGGAVPVTTTVTYSDGRYYVDVKNADGSGYSQMRDSGGHLLESSDTVIGADGTTRLQVLDGNGVLRYQDEVVTLLDGSVVTTTTYADGSSKQRVVNGNGTLFSETKTHPSAEPGGTSVTERTQAQFNENGERVESQFDANGNLISTGISDGTGSWLKVLMPDGRETYTRYDINGAVTGREETIVNLDGSRTRRFYDAEGKGRGITVSVTLVDGTRIDTSTLADGSMVREVTAPDGTVTETPVSFGAQNYASAAAGAVAAWGFLNAAAHGDAVGMVAAGFQFATVVDPQNSALGGVNAGIGAALSAYSLKNAIQQGDGWGVVGSTANLVGSGMQAYANFASGAVGQAAITTTFGAAGMAVMDAIPYVTLVASLARGDVTGSVMSLAAMFTAIPVPYLMVASIVISIATEPNPWGMVSFVQNADGSLGLDLRGKDGGDAIVRGYGQGLLETLNRMLADNQKAIGDSASIGIIAQRLPTLGFNEGRVTLYDIDPATGHDRTINYVEGLPFDAKPGSPESFRDWGRQFIYTALEREAFAPMWEVRTAQMQAARHDPLAGLSELDRAAQAGQLAPALPAGATTQSVRMVTVTPPGELSTGRDGFTAPEDAALDIIAADLLANDNAGGSTRGWTVTAVDNPRHGSVTLVDGLVHFTPSADYAGADAGFSYTVSDGQGHIGHGDVLLTYTETNDAPVVTADGNDGLLELLGAPTEGGGLAPSTYVRDWYHGQLVVVDPDDATFTFTVVSQPREGRVTVDGQGRWAYDGEYVEAASDDAFQIQVNDGDNRLDGREGADTMAGGHGNDTYVIDNAGDRIVEAASQGIDAVEASVDYTLGANVERLTLTGSAHHGTGNDQDNLLIGNDTGVQLDGLAGADTLRGGKGNDSLDGGEGDDQMNGLDGNDNDRLEGGSGADRIDAGAGDDKLIFTADAVATAALHVDNVGSPGRLGTGAEASLDGKNLSQDTFDGGSGIDTLFGTSGNDAIVLDVRNSASSSGGRGGSFADLDPLRGFFGFEGPVGFGGAPTLASLANNGPRLANIERIETGPGDDLVDLTSQRFAYGNVTIDGGEGDDRLWSAGGDDSLIGGKGNDTLVAGAGRDTLEGGLGNDRLEGGTGNDTYRFAKGGGQDTIVEADASFGNVDTLKLTGIKASELVFHRSGADLDVLLNGTTDAVRIKSWYAGTAFQVERFETDDGVVLASQVQSLVNSAPTYYVAPSPLPTPFTPVPEQWLP